MPSSTFTAAYAALISRLADLRKQAGLTQLELARRLGKPQQFVSAVERRARRLDVIELYAVAKAIGANPEELVIDLYRQLPNRPKI